MPNFFYKVNNLISRRFKKSKWRKLNKHNTTFLEYVPDSQDFFNRVTVGKHTYGPIKAIYSGNDKESLSIGNFCSIGSGTTFILGSEHGYKGISTFPFKVKILKASHEAHTKGAIIIHDDVWLGENVLVLSGVTIGRGAVVAAGSVVVKDVPEYSIVGGNPARVIKYRFSEEIIDQLMKIDYGKMSDNKISTFIEDLYTEIKPENITEILNRIDLTI